MLATGDGGKTGGLPPDGGVAVGDVAGTGADDLGGVAGAGETVGE